MGRVYVVNKIHVSNDNEIHGDFEPAVFAYHSGAINHITKLLKEDSSSIVIDLTHNSVISYNKEYDELEYEYGCNLSEDDFTDYEGELTINCLKLL